MPQQWVELISTLSERVRLDNQPHATDEHLYLRKLLIAGRHIEDGARRVAETAYLNVALASPWLGYKGGRASPRRF